MRQSGASAQMFQLRRMLDEIQDGMMGIPDFQRDFDWSETDVRALLVTVFSGWPAGSLLLLDARGGPFRLREFESGPRISAEPKYAVLDGQQRLTSMFQALHGLGDSVFAVKWDLGPNDLDDMVVSYRRKVWDRKYSKPAQQAAAHLIPVASLRDASTFFEWRDLILEQTNDLERSAAKVAITNLYTTTLSRAHDYEFPAVVLESELDPAAIARIFERVNRTGLRLNAFDLMVAKTYDTTWNLRKRWIETRESYPSIGSFLDEDGMPLLQAISLRHWGDIRQSAVLQLPRELVWKDWNDASSAADQAISFLKRYCGVLRRDFMPYANTLAPLIALAMDGQLQQNPRLMAGWFWHTAFTSAFDAAANTRLVSHYRALLTQDIGRLEPDVRDETRIPIVEVTKKIDKSLWLAVICALATKMTAQSGEQITEYVADELEVGSMFSQEDNVPGAAAVASVLNAVIVPQKYVAVTRKLNATATLDYLRRNLPDYFVRSQLPEPPHLVWEHFVTDRIGWLRDFIAANALFPSAIVLEEVLEPPPPPN